jgi:hypothetical protein
MIHPNWMFSVLETAKVMGHTLTHVPIDPSSLISEGIAIGNKIIGPILNTSILKAGFGLIIIVIVYLIVLFTFISIALDLALTLIMTTALITVATFLLGFSGLGATTSIARQTLDAILGNCIKLLGIYLVVATGSQTMKSAISSIPAQFVSFDPYAWIVAVAFLFWLIAKNLPSQLARLISIVVLENQGTDISGHATTAARAAQSIMPIASNLAAGGASIIGSTAYNAAKRFPNSIASTGSLGLGALSAAGGAALDLSKSAMGNIHDRFKNIANKSVGGAGRQQPIQSVSQRMYQKARQHS